MESVKNVDNIFLHGIFLVMLFWDVIENLIPNFQFVLLLVILFMYIVHNKKVIVDKNFLLVISFVFVHGIINCFLKNDNFKLLIIQIGTIGLSYITYSNIESQVSVKKIFDTYMLYSYIMSFIGFLEIIISFFNIASLTNLPMVFMFTSYKDRVLGLLPRISSLCSEPSFLGYFLAPAVYLILDNLFNQKKKIYISKSILNLIVIIVYIFTFSSVAYIGLGVMLIFIWLQKGINFLKVFLPIVAITFFYVIYFNVPFFKIRVDDSLFVFLKKIDSNSVNLSSYTLYNHFNITKKAFISNYGMGSGLGSYQIMFDKFTLGKWNGSSLNRTDANSMMLRIITELGVIGIIGVVWFIKKNYSKKLEYNLLSNSILVLFLMLLFRMGNYTHAGSIMYICLYIKIKNNLWQNLK